MTPYMIVKRFGCMAIHNKALYKCIIHSVLSQCNTYYSEKSIQRFFLICYVTNIHTVYSILLNIIMSYCSYVLAKKISSVI